MIGVSVAICTYRRLDPLRAALESLCACDKPANLEWELVLIDNAGDPAIASMAATFNNSLPIRYVHESTLGTSFARNRAVREAKFPIVLFTDDDVTFDKQWLNAICRAIETHGECDFWGGRVEPVWSQNPPAWFDIKRCPMLGDTIVRYQRGDAPRAYVPDEDPPFYTANLALRKTAMEHVGLFDTTVGHKGDRRMGNEDSLMVKAISKSGGKGWYAADAVVHHPVPSDRVSKSFARRFAWRQGYVSVEMLRRSQANPGAGTPRWLYRASLAEMCRGAGSLLAGLVKFSNADAFAGQIGALYGASKLWHALKAR